MPQITQAIKRLNRTLENCAWKQKVQVTSNKKYSGSGPLPDKVTTTSSGPDHQNIPYCNCSIAERDPSEKEDEESKQ